MTCSLVSLLYACFYNSMALLLLLLYFNQQYLKGFLLLPLLVQFWSLCFFFQIPLGNKSQVSLPIFSSHTVNNSVMITFQYNYILISPLRLNSLQAYAGIYSSLSQQQLAEDLVYNQNLMNAYWIKECINKELYHCSIATV